MLNDSPQKIVRESNKIIRIYRFIAVDSGRQRGVSACLNLPTGEVIKWQLIDIF